MTDARNAIHAALTAVMAWLAIVLAVPGDTFTTSRSYAVMARLASEDHWAMMFWFVACVGFAGLCTSSRSMRFTAVLVLATMHGAVAACLLVGNYASTGSGTYAIIAALGYYLAWRRTRDGL